MIFGAAHLPETVSLDNAEADITIYGASDDDALTNGSLAVGDLNSDGSDDLILGASVADGPSESRSEAGESSSGVSTSGSATFFSFPKYLPSGPANNAGSKIKSPINAIANRNSIKIPNRCVGMNVLKANADKPNPPINVV